MATARSAARLEARNGASIRNDKPIATNAKGERTLAVWRPTDQGMAADELFEHGPEARPPIGGELRENIIVTQTNKGRTIRGPFVTISDGCPDKPEAPMSKGFARRFLLLLTALAVTGVVVLAGGVMGAPVITKLYVCVNTAHPVQRTGATASTVCKPGWVLVSWNVSKVRPVTTHATTTRRATTTTRPSGSSYRSTVMSDRPIAYWRFASTRSETGRHNGKLRGRPAPRLNQPGPFAGDRSIRFDGILRDNARTGGFLANSLARLASSTWSKGFTLEAWVRTTTSGPEQHVMTWSDRAGNAGPGILYDDPDNRWKFRDGNVSLSEADATTINAWHYLVASIDAAGHGTLYVDGVRERTWTSTKHPIATSTGLWTVGADYDAHTCPCPHVDTPFSGWIAETAVYAHPLTAARVRAHLAARRLQRRA